MKLLGAGIVLSLSFYIGFAMAGWEYRRVGELQAFCRLLAHIKECIEDLQLPLSVIFSGYEDAVLEKNGFLPRLRAQMTAEDVMGTVLREMQKERRLVLTDSDTAELLAFSAELGKGDSEREIRRCEYYSKRLLHILETAQGQAPGRARVCRTISVSTGILCVLLLL